VGWEIAAWVYSLSMGAALVYMGEHYVIDILVGGAVTTYAWYATLAWINRLSREPQVIPMELRSSGPGATPAPAET
jgi:membrane-associated phospholipid phosphatase